MEVRQLCENDIGIYHAELKELLVSCYDATHTFSVSERFCEEKLEGLRQYLRDGKAYLFGALDEDSHLVGFTWNYEYFAGIDRRYHCAYIAVAPQAAGQGIGHALMAAAEQKAWSLGIRYIDLAVGTENRNAQSFYERQGFEPERLYMKKKVKRHE